MLENFRSFFLPQRHEEDRSIVQTLFVHDSGIVAGLRSGRVAIDPALDDIGDSHRILAR